MDNKLSWHRTENKSIKAVLKFNRRTFEFEIKQERRLDIHCGRKAWNVYLNGIFQTKTKFHKNQAEARVFSNRLANQLLGLDSYFSI